MRINQKAQNALLDRQQHLSVISNSLELARSSLYPLGSIPLRPRWRLLTHQTSARGPACLTAYQDTATLDGRTKAFCRETRLLQPIEKTTQLISVRLPCRIPCLHHRQDPNRSSSLAPLLRTKPSASRANGNTRSSRKLAVSPPHRRRAYPSTSCRVARGHGRHRYR